MTAVSPKPAGGGPPRRIAWVLLLAAAAAVTLTGVLGTLLILGGLAGTLESLSGQFWARLAVAGGLTVASLTIRSLRWVFLLRRAQTRIPIRDAYIGYFAGLSLLLAPFLLGEMAVRAAVLRRRGGVPVATTILVNLWERFLDLSALALITGALALALGRANIWTGALLATSVATLIGPFRRSLLRMAAWASRHAASPFDRSATPDLHKLGQARSWMAALIASVAAWSLPGLALWHLVRGVTDAVGLAHAEFAYAAASSLAGLVLAPGGVLVAGTALLAELEMTGVAPSDAALSVFGIRLATVGLATMLGVVFGVLHLRSPAADSTAHFDELAEAYDVQIPEGRRQALLALKTSLMRDAIAAHLPGARRGLDAGCGQGWYVKKMRELGFDVDGIDMSAGQVVLATANAGAGAQVAIGSVLRVPAADAAYDFVYIINVLHHLGSVEEQRRAFAELLRVLRPGGLLFVHEINTRNILFRFYMGYVFPSLNCIDEGVERWLLPHKTAMYTDAPLVDLRYFTFFPDFLPQGVVRLLRPIERLLEASPLRVFSAHYMAVLRRT